MNEIRIACAAVALLAALTGCGAAGFQGAAAPPWSGSVNVLASSRDRDALEKAAMALASSGDPRAVARLGEFLRQPAFLARLDDIGRPAEKTWHLQRVFMALAEHSSPATERLCLTLAGDPAFLADDDRRIYLLPALAAVAPMSENAIAVFRRAGQEGYYSTVAPLLVKNGSPRALALFEDMIRDRNVPGERRVDALHASILSRRTELAVLESVGHLMAAPLEGEVVTGLIESVFDYQSRRWFGPARSAPAPPPWEHASEAALRKVLALATNVKASHSLSPELLAAVKQTEDTVRRILARPGK
jgi:hypothetical protein